MAERTMDHYPLHEPTVDQRPLYERPLLERLPHKGPLRERPLAECTAAMAGDLRTLGLRRGTKVLAHASLHGTGLRASTVRDALLEVGGEVVPTFTAENSVSAAAHLGTYPGIAGEQVQTFRATMPAFDPERTPSRRMGRPSGRRPARCAVLIRRLPSPLWARTRRHCSPSTNRTAVSVRNRP